MQNRFTLRELLRRAEAGNLPGGWIYLPTSETPSLDTECLLLADADGGYDDHGTPLVAVEQGFPCEGLDSDSTVSTAQWAAQFVNPPTDDLLLESFLYYWRFDAFLPEPGAPEPPPWEEAKRRLDREFYEGLGDERGDVACQGPGCNRGAIHLSVFCRIHHFESIKRERCPFTD
jgi:hypothetical protein